MKFPIPRRCARCGDVLPWQRMWGLSWSHEPWACAGCGGMLKVDLDRRSNLTFVSTVFICGLMAMCFTYSWNLAMLAIPGLAGIWMLDRPVLAEESDHS